MYKITSVMGTFSSYPPNTHSNTQAPERHLMTHTIRLLPLLLLLLFFTAPSSLARKHNHMMMYQGGIVRTDTTRRQLTLVFTAADKNDGVEQILSTLKRHRIKAAFFLTGSFLEKYPEDVARIRKAGHYIGSHSYSHPLYSTWEKPDSTIVTREFFEQDILRSYQALAPYGITLRNAPFFMPPYEHYNATIAEWANSMGLTLVNFTSGTASNADYTTPSMKNYRSSDNILQTILQKEESEGLNGHLMLFHAGTSPERTDKFYTTHLHTLILELRQRGYRFVPLTKAIR